MLLILCKECVKKTIFGWLRLKAHKWLLQGILEVHIRKHLWRVFEMHFRNDAWVVFIFFLCCSYSFPLSLINFFSGTWLTTRTELDLASQPKLLPLGMRELSRLRWLKNSVGYHERKWRDQPLLFLWVVYPECPHLGVMRRHRKKFTFLHPMRFVFRHPVSWSFRRHGYLTKEEKYIWRYYELSTRKVYWRSLVEVTCAWKGHVRWDLEIFSKC